MYVRQIRHRRWNMSGNVNIYQFLCMSRMQQKVKFSWGVQQVPIQSFPSPRSVTISRVKNTVCPTILPRALCEKQIASSRISARVAVFIFYNINHYTMCTSIKCVYICIYIYITPFLPSQAGCDTRSIFKQSTIVLNLVSLLFDWVPN